MTPLSSALVHVRRGDTILDIESGEPVTVLDFYLTPNSREDPRLMCVIIARRVYGNRVFATANHFAALPDEPYEPRFPSDMDRVETP